MSRTYDELMRQQAEDAGFASVGEYQRALDEAWRQHFEWIEESAPQANGEDDELQEVS